MKAWVAHHNAIELMGGAPAGVDVVVWGGNTVPPAELDNVALFVPPTWNKPASLDVLPRLTGLRAIQLLSAGADWILPYTPAGVTLCDARGAHDPAVAEWIMTAILTVLREFNIFSVDQSRAVWNQRGTDTLYGKRVLIIGHGSIGTALEQRLGAFCVSVCRVARHPRPDAYSAADLPGLLAGADVVVLLVPLTAETRGMVDADFLARMPDRALLVNASRGPVVDTDALTREVSTGRLLAALDVTDPEPLTADHPLWTLPGSLLTPHVASFTPTWLPRIYHLVRRQLTHLVDGTSFENPVVDGY